MAKRFLWAVVFFAGRVLTGFRERDSKEQSSRARLGCFCLALAFLICFRGKQYAFGTRTEEAFYKITIRLGF